MIGSDEIITGVVGTGATILGSFISWILAKKKYDSEVDNSTIINMQEALKFYKELSDDNKERLNRLQEEKDVLEREVANLKNELFEVVKSICTDLTCQYRKNDLIQKALLKEKKRGKKNEKKNRVVEG